MMEDMRQLNLELQRIWPQWRALEILGKGAFGTVYRISREGKYESALKVIEIPGSREELQEQYGEGGTSESIRSQYLTQIQQLETEIEVMESLKSALHVVGIEDHAIIEKRDEIGWKIYIRMELLQSMGNYLAGREPLTEKEVINLGIDICDALEACHSKNIIHRDIKPANIFISSFGDFKLGDFGIARKLEESKASTKAGTPQYEAPEIIRGELYDKTVDLYALGMVLYTYMNRGRKPFFPPSPQPVSYSDQAEANQRRMNGEPFPDPVDASKELAAVIRKACAYHPQERYLSASEMKYELQGLLSGGAHSRVGIPPATRGPVVREPVTQGPATQGSVTRGTTTRGPAAKPDNRPPVVPPGSRLSSERTGGGTVRAGNNTPDYEGGTKRGGPLFDDDEETGKIQRTDTVKKKSHKGLIIIAAVALAAIAAIVTVGMMSKKYTLTVAGGTGSGSYKPGTEVEIKAEEKEGYTFSGWEATGVELTSEDTDKESITLEMPRNEAEVKAVYEAVFYRTNVIGGSGSGEYVLGDTVTIKADTPPAGFHFAGWKINVGPVSFNNMAAEEQEFVMPAENVELEAVFEQGSYQLVVNGGSGTGTYGAYDTVNISAESEKDGSVFSYWSVDEGSVDIPDISALNVSFAMPEENVIITAHYETIQYTLHVQNGQGSGTFSAGEAVKVTAEETNDYGEVFKKWSVASGNPDLTEQELSQSILTFSMPAEDVSLQAQYEAPVNTITTPEPATQIVVQQPVVTKYVLSVNGGSGGGEYEAGTRVQVTSNPSAGGKAFAYWIVLAPSSGSSIDRSPTLTFSMPAEDVTITAVYE